MIRQLNSRTRSESLTSRPLRGICASRAMLSSPKLSFPISEGIVDRKSFYT
jgi:hypothetical protein